MQENKNLLILIAIISVPLVTGNSNCPDSKWPLVRLGDSRFYMLVDLLTYEGFVSRSRAAEECKKYGLELAKVPNMLTMAVLGRALERTVSDAKINHTWFWLNGKYDDLKEAYYWVNPQNPTDTNDILKYSHFLYRHPRPLGFAGHSAAEGGNQEDMHPTFCMVKHCITLALPWPRIYSQDSGVIYGHQTLFDEKPCKGPERRSAICESRDAGCRLQSSDTFLLTEDRLEYFEKGNWIFGDRKYIVNWKQRTFAANKAYCESLGLRVMEPGTTEKHLIPFLKMWSREVTVSHFWTSFTYEGKTKTFLNREGQPVATQDSLISESEALARSLKSGGDFCVAVSFIYEFKDQINCPATSDQDQDPDDGALCDWSFLEYVPSVCGNYHGAICQHKDANQREIKWKPEYTTNVKLALAETATTSFGFAENGETHRSTYKQTFGSLVCKPGYRMLRAKNQDWSKEPESSPIFLYDYLETFWVVDDQLFSKNADSDCTVSEPDPKSRQGFERKLKKVKCNEWHFYLCEKITKRLQPYKGKVEIPPDPEWRSGPQPRIYPIENKEVTSGTLNRNSELDLGLDDTRYPVGTNLDNFNDFNDF